MKVLLFVVAGVLLFLLFRLNKAKEKEEFSWRLFFVKQWFSTVLNVISGAIIVFGIGLHEEPILFSGRDVTFFIAAIIGFSGQALFKEAVCFFNRKVSSKLGINKKP